MFKNCIFNLCMIWHGIIVYHSCFKLKDNVGLILTWNDMHISYIILYIFVTSVLINMYCTWSWLSLCCSLIIFKQTRSLIVRELVQVGFNFPSEFRIWLSRELIDFFNGEDELAFVYLYTLCSTFQALALDSNGWMLKIDISVHCHFVNYLMDIVLPKWVLTWNLKF